MFNTFQNLKRTIHHLRYAYNFAKMKQSKIFHTREELERCRSLHCQLALLVPLLRTLEKMNQASPKRSSGNARDWAVTYQQKYEKLVVHVKNLTHYQNPNILAENYPDILNVEIPLPGRNETTTLQHILEKEMAKLSGEKRKYAKAYRDFMASLTDTQKEQLRIMNDCSISRGSITIFFKNI